ncbi:DUF523 domain-containing protein [Candidatus Xianfuyuplasma coldseepsis]|uniref:DUF523 domain-containing protein n=1 Tax=Candidatus Xianfuyuplasma coldseepsis TaxID=2782163 RepID=A0A7L7KP78_9MOLU|nr:DUF523 domain-containing protein [Xianfuyuplasma coldseepsis]QMS84590.1 DUF523 domain-containing protein [Xianfuyuplasma coldseepsis]
MYLISACLIGEQVKYDGNDNFHEVAKQLVDHNLAIPVCPEVLGGMTVPRIPSEIVGDSVFSKTGEDVTHFFMNGAQKTLKIAKENHVTIAILQARSPSCGSKQVYDGTFSGRLIEGQGITTSLLEQHGIRVITIEEYIKDYYEQDF